MQNLTPSESPTTPKNYIEQLKSEVVLFKSALQPNVDLGIATDEVKVRVDSAKLKELAADLSERELLAKLGVLVVSGLAGFLGDEPNTKTYADLLNGVTLRTASTYGVWLREGFFNLKDDARSLFLTVRNVNNFSDTQMNQEMIQVLANLL